MQKIIISILMFNSFIIYANISSEAKNILTIIDTKNNEYHSGNRLVKVSEVKEILNKIDKSENLTKKEKLYLSIESYTLWANISIANGNFEEDYKTLLSNYNSIKKDKDFKNANSDIYSSFSNFANSLTSLALFNNNYPYSIIVDMYNYSRLALLYDRENTKAKQIYGMWQIATLGFYNNSAYYSIIESLSYTNTLPDYMIYRAYIYRSMAYMKVNETQKAFDELNKAIKMYPNGFYGYLLKKSYDKGLDGFLNSKGVDF